MNYNTSISHIYSVFESRVCLVTENIASWPQTAPCPFDSTSSSLTVLFWPEAKSDGVLGKPRQ